MIVNVGKTNRDNGTSLLRDGTDLNDVAEPGSYVVPGGGVIANDPCANWATMLVMGGRGSMTSQVMVGIAGQTYTRVKSGSPAVWHPWNQVADSGTPPLVDRGVVTASDFNLITKEGMHVINGRTMANRPTGMSGLVYGHLVVLYRHGSIVCQLLMTNGNAYYRYKTTSGWSSWKVLGNA